MSECKNCIHYDVCGEKDFKKLTIERGFGCEHFKDKAKTIELPCEIGDEIYEICERRKNGKWHKVIIKRIVDSFVCGAEGVELIRCGTTINIFISNLNKTAFLTKKAAEQALKGIDM